MRYNLYGTVTGPNIMRFMGAEAVQIRRLKLLTGQRLQYRAVFTPLTVAILSKNVDICATLIFNGAKIGQEEIVICIWIGEVALFLAIVFAYLNKKQRVKNSLTWLKSPGPAKNQVGAIEVNKRGGTYCEQLSKDKKEKLIKVLKTHHLNRSLVEFAIHWQKHDILEYIFEHCEVPTTKTSRSHPYTYVTSLIQFCDEKLIAKVLGRSPLLAKTLVSGTLRQSPLHMACLFHKYDTIKLLVSTYKADINARDSDGRTPFSYAVNTVCRCARYAIYSRKCKACRAPLVMNCEMHSRIEMIYYLLKSGADLRLADRFGCTTLISLLLEWSGNETVDPILNSLVQLLIDAGANANAKTHSGATPLHICAQKRRLSAAELLLANGAKIVGDDKKRIPGQYCMDYSLRPLFLRMETKVQPLRNKCLEVLSRKGPLPQSVTYRL